MNIAQIRYFVTAAQLQNLSKAAEALHLSQPALSKSIAKLEEELGTPLFIRQGKSVALNEPGRRFLQSAWVILRQVDNTMLDLSEMTFGTTSRISVGLYQPDEKITSCLAAFASKHPETELYINCFIDSEEILDINKYDMLLYPDGNRYIKFHSHFLHSEPYLLAIPAGHSLAAEKSISPKQLSGLPFVFVNRDQQYIEEPYFLCAGLNLRLKSMYFTNAREQHKQLVASGVALGFVPECCSAPYKADPRIVLRPVSDSKFSRRIMLCFKKDKHLTPAGKDFRDFVINNLGLDVSHNKD
ncbi:MAG: LysR family transcriptional regulator [Oscillospiraceae bacterium]|nr:LysR family transcriptional regulator [Oscillospiraceae bacterium]